MSLSFSTVTQNTLIFTIIYQKIARYSNFAVLERHSQNIDFRLVDDAGLLFSTVTKNTLIFTIIY